MRLIDAEALKKAIKDNGYSHYFEIFDIIDNAPTVPLHDFKEGYKQAIIDGKTNFSRPQGKWKVKTKSTFPQYQPDEYLCPFCNTIVNYKTNFCHNCGAQMGKEGAE